MSCRTIPCSFLAACLVFAGVAAWLPGDVASRPQSEAEPEPAGSDARLIAGECSFFVTFRPADFLGDELSKAILQEVPKAMEQELHVPADGIARLTLAAVLHGPVQIVRTKKPYDAEKLRKALTESRYGSKTTTTFAKDKDKGFRDEPREPVVGEKKAGGKKIYYAGELSRWTTGWCPIDKTTFMMGPVAAIQALLETKGKPSAEMTDALALASKHSLVMALDGKRLRTLFRQQREEREREQREWMKKREERFKDFPKDSDRDKDSPKDKDKGGFSRGGKSAREVFVSARLPEGADDKAKGDDDDVDAMFHSLGAVLLPYKPLLSAKFGLLTLDVGKTDTLTARIDFADKADLDDGETALKSVLYVGRQLANMLPKAERDFGGLKPLSVPVRKAFEEAKVERKGTTLSTTVTLTPEAGLAKKVREGIAEENKKHQKMYREKDKARFADKAVPSDKS